MEAANDRNVCLTYRPDQVKDFQDDVTRAPDGTKKGKPIRLQQRCAARQKQSAVVYSHQRSG
jgi:hypothetical protein